MRRLASARKYQLTSRENSEIHDSPRGVTDGARLRPGPVHRALVRSRAACLPVSPMWKKTVSQAATSGEGRAEVTTSPVASRQKNTSAIGKRKCQRTSAAPNLKRPPPKKVAADTCSLVGPRYCLGIKLLLTVC
jgi:hypothetical protein